MADPVIDAVKAVVIPAVANEAGGLLVEVETLVAPVKKAILADVKAGFVALVGKVGRVGAFALLAAGLLLVGHFL